MPLWFFSIPYEQASYTQLGGTSCTVIIDRTLGPTESGVPVSALPHVAAVDVSTIPTLVSESSSLSHDIQMAEVLPPHYGLLRALETPISRPARGDLTLAHNLYDVNDFGHFIQYSGAGGNQKQEVSVWSLTEAKCYLIDSIFSYAFQVVQSATTCIPTCDKSRRSSLSPLVVAAKTESDELETDVPAYDPSGRGNTDVNMEDVPSDVAIADDLNVNNEIAQPPAQASSSCAGPTTRPAGPFIPHFPPLQDLLSVAFGPETLESDILDVLGFYDGNPMEDREDQNEYMRRVLEEVGAELRHRRADEEAANAGRGKEKAKSRYR
ncbi:hypothetical protein C8R47DRAFT_1228228 [Mycena vitilis]|nr:hypothetical protein C8R47DRAFT_1228228 [Mycena vitilis]